jgi:hypothetical protein
MKGANFKNLNWDEILGYRGLYSIILLFTVNTQLKILLDMKTNIAEFEHSYNQEF